MVPDWLAEMDWKNFKKIEMWQKNTCGKAAVLEMLQGAIIFQIFPCIRKLVLQENFLRHIQKYVFFVWCNRIVAVSERYSLNLVFFTYVPHHSKLAPEFLSSHPRQAKKISLSLRQHFFKNLFSPTAERGGGLSKFN